MSTKIFLLAVGFLALFIVVTSPPVVRPFFQYEPTSTPTTVLPSPTLSPTPTVDPFASVPTATPQAQSFVAVQQLPAATLGDAPPTFTPPPARVTAEKQAVILLPDPNSEAGPRALLTVNGEAPERLKIPKLKLNARIQPVGWVSSSGVENAVAGGMPADEADVGWVGDSAAFRQAGNTVLTGRHQATAAFYKLWTLAAGDKITLSAGVKSRQYVVSDIFVLAEDEEPLPVRVSNAALIKPTQDERLTLVTGGQSERQRTVVIALPK